MSDAPDDLGIPMKPSRPQPQAGNVAPLSRAPILPGQRAPEAARPVAEPARPGDSPVRPGAMGIGAAPRRPDAEARRLIVGRDISLSGEINSCDKMIIEGSVEANLQNCNEVDIAESGLFKGSATVEEAEVRGRFEGNLTVRRRLMIRASGRVSGTIRYGQIEIECGGRIAGDVQAQAAEDLGQEAPGARAAS